MPTPQPDAISYAV